MVVFHLLLAEISRQMCLGQKPSTWRGRGYSAGDLHSLALGTATDSVGSVPGHAFRLASSSLGHASGKRGCSIGLPSGLWIYTVWLPHPLLRHVPT